MANKILNLQGLLDAVKKEAGTLKVAVGIWGECQLVSMLLGNTIRQIMSDEMNEQEYIEKWLIK